MDYQISINNHQMNANNYDCYVPKFSENLFIASQINARNAN